jgi:hypothetical protein
VAVKESQKILKKYNIDLDSQQNLVWAPNWGHPDTYAEAVYNTLNDIVVDNTGSSKEAIKALLITALQGLARQYNAGDWRPKS